jgi:hypothetical protein
MQIISDIVARDYLHKQSVDIVYGQQCASDAARRQ